MKTAIVAGVLLLAFAPAGRAALIAVSASQTSPLAPPAAALVDVGLGQAMAAASQAAFGGPAYAIAFAGVDTDEGLVQGQDYFRHAVPVAGVTGGQALYLTGGYGSALTASHAASGNYLSTGGPGGQITISFAIPQQSLALLWGSVDDGNLLSFLDAQGNVLDTLSGKTVEADASISAEGFQGAGGSAYVSVLESTPFAAVRLSSAVISFEAAGIVAGNTGFVPAPEPVALGVLAAGLAALGIARRRG